MKLRIIWNDPDGPALERAEWLWGHFGATAYSGDCIHGPITVLRGFGA